jgi:hypothetical protein
MYSSILEKIFQERILLSQHILLYCYDETVLKEIFHKYVSYPFSIIHTKTSSYLKHESVFLFDMKKCREDKYNLLTLIKDIALTKEHFTKYQFKYIILLNFDHSNDYFQKGLKSYLDQYGVIFIFLCSKFSKIQKYILSHVVQIRIKVPLTYEKNRYIMINRSYQNQKKYESIVTNKIRLTKEVLLQKLIHSFKKDLSQMDRSNENRDFAYHFLITGYPFSDFLRLIHDYLIQNLLLPNRIKGLLIKELSFCENLYGKCFKKGIIVEYTFLKIYDILHKYTYCL